MSCNRRYCFVQIDYLHLVSINFFRMLVSEITKQLLEVFHACLQSGIVPMFGSRRYCLFEISYLHPLDIIFCRMLVCDITDVLLEMFHARLQSGSVLLLASRYCFDEISYLNFVSINFLCFIACGIADHVLKRSFQVSLTFFECLDRFMHPHDT